MATIALDELKGKEVISSDAYLLGNVQDVRYDPVSWDVLGLKVKSNKDVSKIISAGSARSMILVRPGDYAINDVILFRDTLEDSKDRISADNDNVSSLSFIIGKKIVSSDGLLVGIVSDVLLEMEQWSVQSVKVKLDKGAYEPLGLKKGIFSKTASGILVTHISAVTDNMSLYLTAKDLAELLTVD
jgi:sporulation protein YlmC with PRC-barrel domain